ncbi:MAG: hypothetical protein IKI00_09355 [Bacteroidales bacterium]|nr:hypothetical protein [Bacteroidales bacterium]
MLTFDKLKIVSTLSNIEIIDEDKFQKVMANGSVVLLKYYQDNPFLLDIKIDYIEQELVIEFTGRVLGKEYSKLISIETINRCFENINALGFCRINIEGMMDADVVKCDVSTDIHVEDVSRLTKYIRNHVGNYQRYMCRKMKNGNLTIEKNVTSKKYKKRITIYDKGREMGLAGSKEYVEANGLEGKFDGLCRFEVNLNTKEQIRQSLQIQDTKLRSVLMSDAHPIRDFMDDIMKCSDEPREMKDKKSYLTMLVLKDCSFDLEKVEAKMRSLHPKRGLNIRKIMEPYRAMMESLGEENEPDMWREILDQLS